MKHDLYRHLDADGRLLYIGIARDASKRLAGHRAQSPWFAEIAAIKIDTFDTREEAAAAERRAVIEEKPLHNVMYNPEAAKAARPKRGVRLAWHAAPSTQIAVNTLALQRRTSRQELLFEAVTDLFAKYGVTPDEDGHAALLRRFCPKV